MKTKNRYEKMTDADFERLLYRLAANEGTPGLLAMPGVYEIVSEELNNGILEAWELENPEDETDE